MPTHLALLGVLTLQCLCVQAAEPLQLQWKDRYLTVSGAQIPGGPIRTHYLEAYCRPGSTDREWKDTVIPHRSRLLQSAKNGQRIKIEDRLSDGVIVHHVITSTHDEVTFTVTATNPTDSESLAHWAQPCMRVDSFTGTNQEDNRKTQPPYIKKCFLIVDDQLTRLPTSPWAIKARYIPGQVYVPAGVDRNDANPRPLSELIPSHGLTGCFSADEKTILAVAWNPFQEIFQGVITCMHNDFRIGGLKPGETKVIHGRMYIVPANQKTLMQRFRKDFDLPE